VDDRLGGSEADAPLTDWAAKLREGACVGAPVSGGAPIRREAEVFGDAGGDGVVAPSCKRRGEGGGEVAEVEEGAKVKAGADDLQEDTAVGEALHGREGGGEFGGDVVEKGGGEGGGAQGEAEELEAVGGVLEGGLGEGVTHEVEGGGGEGR